MEGVKAVFVTPDMCKETTGKILDSQGKLHDKLDAIEKRLFHDNGTLSVQTRLDRHEQFIRVLLWALAVIVGTVLTSSVMGFILLFKWAVAQGATL